MDESHQRGNALFTALWHIFQSGQGHTRTSPLSSPGWFEVWCSFNTLQDQAPTGSIAPCHAQMYHLNLDTLALHSSSSPQVTWPQVGQLKLPICSQKPLPAAYPIPGFAPLSVADTLSKSPSPVKGALTSTSEQALHSRHQAQERAKQHQLSEVRWIYVAGHCRGWLSAGQRADKAKTLFTLALSRLQATSQDARAHIPALRLSLPQQLVPEQ